MTGFTFHILKLNTIAALIICAACIVSRLTRKEIPVNGNTLCGL